MSVDSCLSRRGRSSLGSVKSGTNSLPRHKIVHECLYVIRSAVLLIYKNITTINKRKILAKKQKMTAMMKILLPGSRDSMHAVCCCKRKKRRHQQKFIGPKANILYGIGYKSVYFTSQTSMVSNGCKK